MGLFGKILKLGMDIVEAPVAVIKDVATLGGALTDKKQPYTMSKLEDLQDDWDSIKDSLDD